MKKITLFVLVTGVCALFLYAGCGGGDGTTPPPPPALPTTAVVTLTSSGTLPAGKQMGATDVAINIPASVSIKATPGKASSSMVTYSGLAVVSGVAAGTNAMSLATYTPPNQVSVRVANPNGFGIGEFATVTFDIASGSEVVPAEFSVGTFTAVDLNGVPISGLSGELAVVLK